MLGGPADPLGVNWAGTGRELGGNWETPGDTGGHWEALGGSEWEAVGHWGHWDGKGELGGHGGDMGRCWVAQWTPLAVNWEATGRQWEALGDSGWEALGYWVHWEGKGELGVHGGDMGRCWVAQWTPLGVN